MSLSDVAQQIRIELTFSDDESRKNDAIDINNEICIDPSIDYTQSDWEILLHNNINYRQQKHLNDQEHLTGFHIVFWAIKRSESIKLEKTFSLIELQKSLETKNKNQLFKEFAAKLIKKIEEYRDLFQQKRSSDTEN